MASLNSTKVYVSILVIACCSAVFYNFGFEIGTQNALKKKYGYFRSEMIKDTAVFLCAQLKFVEADSYFDELTPEEEEALNSISQALKVAECYAQQGRKMKADIAIKAAKRLLRTTYVTAVYQSAKTLNDDRSCFRAGILSKTAVDMYKAETLLHHDIIYSQVSECIHNIIRCVLKNFQSDGKIDGFVMNYVMPTLENMFPDIRGMKLNNPTLKASSESAIAISLSVIYFYATEHQKSIMYSEIVIEICEKEFGKDASNQLFYADAKTLIADNYIYLDKRKKSEVYYSEAIQIQKKMKGDKLLQRKIDITIKKLDLILTAEYRSTPSELIRLFSNEK